MAKSTTATKTDKPKRTRTRAAKYYLATVRSDTPMLILAKSQKDALAAILTLRSAAPADILAAGRSGYQIIDTSVPAAELSQAA